MEIAQVCPMWKKQIRMILTKIDNTDIADKNELIEGQEIEPEETLDDFISDKNPS